MKENKTLNLVQLCLPKIQNESYQHLLEKGKKEEMEKLLKYIKYRNFKLKINTNKIKYKKPKKSMQKCIFNETTYSISIYVPITLEYKNTKIIKNKYLLIGEIPLLTEKGTFIINGNPRIIVNQIVRSPGIYFETNLENLKIKAEVKTLTIIPSKGSWLTLKLDSEGKISIKIDKMTKKIPILIFLQCLGLSRKKILYSVKNPKTLINCLIFELKPNSKITVKKSTRKALSNINEILGKKSSIKFARDFIYSKIMNEKFYNLGEIGREQLNKNFYSNRINLKKKSLSPEDILGSLDILLQYKKQMRDNDNIDDLKNKRLISVGELIINQMAINIYNLKDNIIEKIKKLEKNFQKNKNKIEKEITKVINPYIMENLVRKFFTINKLSQLMEETNPLSEITHKRKISCFGKGSQDKKQVKSNVREIHTTQYGRICPIETAEGKNTGLVLSIAINAKINKYGFLETSFYVRFKITKIQNKKGIFFISSEQEKELFLAPGDLLIKKIEKQTNKQISLRKNYEFIKENIKKINFISTSPIQMISLGTALIPFLEHNDANRALMGSNMQRQAVTLLKKQKPIVGTGLENITGHSSESSLISKSSGKVTYISKKKIIIHEKLSKKLNYENKYLLKKIKKNLKKKYDPNFRKYKKKTIFLQNRKKSNQNIYINQKTIVEKKEWVKKGQILADGMGTLYGELALGKNILIGYMPWEGYNFEDAIIISEKLVKKNIFTSINIKKYKSFLIKDENGEETTTKNIPNINLAEIKNLNKNGIIKIGSKVKNEQILIGKIKKLIEQKKTNLILSKIFKKNIIKNTSFKLPKGTKGTIILIKKTKRKPNFITIYLAEKRKINIGDKISGKHGNKGVISKILPIEDMPYLQDGTPLDMILNPLGIPSRMNIGQILECLLGLAGKNLKENYKVSPFDEKYGKETSKIIVYNKLYEARQKTKKNWIFNPNYPGKIKLIDGRTGKVFKQPISVGYAYMLKLCHIAKDKITSRSTGPYSLITNQPLGGKAKRGGQRFGEMEVWALEGFGAAYTLQEILTTKSDDIKSRNNLLYSIIKQNKIPKPGTPESFKVLILELQSLCLEIGIFNENKTRKIYN
uniref:DNA-directed RNA polymerase subunit beta n=1 Tax=Discoplastis spathirhyncha TaxID=215771 RepID=A0A3G3LL88_9EUGL|nr:RNA polymerase beta subunit [Discoplastis spathirhyncha]AYQ93471.1 RNA polymerase beta subunit [Discoplastis spathirhyncha]